MLERFFLQLYLCLEDMKNCIISILRDKSASAKIPRCILDELARCFLPDIIAFYEAPEGRAEYKDWKLAQTQQTPQKAAGKP